MLPLLVVVTALLLGLSRASWDGKPQQSPQIVAVSDPEPYRPPDTPANQTLYPGDGQGPCQIALRQAMDIAQSCLYNGSRQNEDVAQFCSGPDGCRQSLLDPIANVATSCRADPGSYWNVLALFDQVAFVTGSRCPTTEASCDQQARLVLNMMRLKMDTTGARAYQCSDCVKKVRGGGAVRPAGPDIPCRRPWDE